MEAPTQGERCEGNCTTSGGAAGPNTKVSLPPPALRAPSSQLNGKGSCLRLPEALEGCTLNTCFAYLWDYRVLRTLVHGCSTRILVHHLLRIRLRGCLAHCSPTLGTGEGGKGTLAGQLGSPTLAFHQGSQNTRSGSSLSKVELTKYLARTRQAKPSSARVAKPH